jgi:hypothetical protein
VGAVVHRPANMTPSQLQKEIIQASKKIYSVPRLLHAVITKRGIERILFIGEFFWQASVRSDLRRELDYLRTFDDAK